MKRCFGTALSRGNRDGEHSFRLYSAICPQELGSDGEQIELDQMSRPTDLQQRTLDLLDVRPRLESVASWPHPAGP